MEHPERMDNYAIGRCTLKIGRFRDMGSTPGYAMSIGQELGSRLAVLGIFKEIVGRDADYLLSGSFRILADYADPRPDRNVIVHGWMRARLTRVRDAKVVWNEEVRSSGLARFDADEAYRQATDILVIQASKGIARVMEMERIPDMEGKENSKGK